MVTSVSRIAFTSIKTLYNRLKLSFTRWPARTGHLVLREGYSDLTLATLEKQLTVAVSRAMTGPFSSPCRRTILQLPFEAATNTLPSRTFAGTGEVSSKWGSLMRPKLTVRSVSNDARNDVVNNPPGSR